MFKRLLPGVLFAAFACVLVMGIEPGVAQVPKNISQTVGVCDPAYPTRCIKPDASGIVPVSGTVTATNASIGATGAAAPASATEIGFVNGSGNLTAPSATNPLPASLTPLATAATGVAPVPSTAAEACRVFKASAGNVYSVSGYTGAAAWIMLFNATSAPVDGAVTPNVWAYAPAAGSFSINYGSLPAYFSVGATACISSTGPLTKTAVATNNVLSGRVQ